MHEHEWNNAFSYSGGQCFEVFCLCGKRRMAKSKDSEYPVEFAIKESICSRLLALLASKGVRLDFCPVEMGRVVGIPWAVGLMSLLGQHSRVSRSAYSPDWKWPDWLFDFDRWIARLDGDGDSNLILFLGGCEVFPIDWGMTFSWASPYYEGPYSMVKHLTNLNMTVHPEVQRARNPKTAEIIGQLSDEQIRLAVFGGNDTEKQVRIKELSTAYWTGLCLRKRLL